jgi:hypothetical protein
MFTLTLPRRMALALAVGLLVAFAADAQPTRPDLSGRLQRITADLDLSSAQQSALNGIAERYEGADGAALWQAAVEVEQVLSDAQVAQLRESMSARRAEREEARGHRPRGDRRMRGRRGDRQGRAQRPDGLRSERPDRPRLTEEQRESLREARTASRQQMQDLVQQLRDGEITDDAFVAQSRALREQMEAQLREALPAEQQERMTEMTARRDAVKTARENALGLTDAQKDAYQTLALDRLRAAPGQPDLRPFLDDEGRLDRQALRESQREQRESMREEREARREQVEDILTDEQQAIVAVHRALAGGSRGMRRGGMRGRGMRGRRGADMGAMPDPFGPLGE